VAEEVVELRGHLIDSLILPRVLDVIMAHRACFEIQEIRVGARPQDPSWARLLIVHREPRVLEAVLERVARFGAEPVERREVALAPAPRAGVFPDDFYATTNLETSIYLGGRWVPVRPAEMDSAIVVSSSRRRARPIKMAKVKRGDLIVVGRQGVRVVPVESRREPGDFGVTGAGPFGFMTSQVSTEKPKGVLIAAVARLMKAERRAGRPILWVCGPAVVHSGGGPLLQRLVAAGYVQILFAGNALAAHDVECALMGTSLGVPMREGVLSAPSKQGHSRRPASSSVGGDSLVEGQRSRHGHENHLRAINRIRGLGGIRQAVRRGVLRRGLMHACVEGGVDVVLAGSIRDDGPLPEVITDSLRAQDAMRRRARKVRLAVMVATLLHSVATGNMLPAAARVVAVDIQQSAVTKLMDRGTFQTIGIVTDVQPFLRELLLELGA
jgi:hypothetical protein